MTIYIPLLFVLTGMMVFTGFLNLLLSRNVTHKAQVIAFGLFNLLWASYTFLNAQLYQAATPFEHMELLRWQSLFYYSGLWVFLFFSQLHFKHLNWKFLVPAFIVLVGLLPLKWADPNLLLYESTQALRTLTLPWGETLKLMSGQPTSLMLIVSLLTIGSLLAITIQSGILWRRKRERHGFWLFMGSGVFLGGQIFDVLTNLNLWDIPLVAEFVYFGLFGFMTTSIVREAFLSQLLKKQLTIKDKITEQSREGIAFTDPLGHIQYANPAFSTLTDWNEKALLDMPLSRALRLESLSAFKKTLALHLQNNTSWSGKLLPTRGDGKNFRAQGSFAPVYDNQEAILGFYLTLRDITEEEVFVERYNEIQRLGAIQRLTSGFAHDFRNILSSVKGHLDLMEMDLKQGQCNTEELLDTAKIIRSVTSNAGEMVNQLLNQSLERTDKLRPLDLKGVLEDVAKMISPNLPQQIQIELNFPPEPVKMNGWTSALHQILFNLCLNAIESMTVMRGNAPIEKGQLILSLESMPATVEFCRTHPGFETESSVVVVKVKDTGVGIPLSIRHKLFEPFFTTKREHGGTGLGLAMIVNMTSQMKGLVTVESEVGKGSEFQLFFPKCLEESIERLKEL